MRKALRLLLIAAAIGLCAVGWMYSVATRDPAVRRASVEMPDWPLGEPPIRVVLLSDIHIAGPDMPPSRLRRIVDQVNGLKPDAVLIAGDFVSDKTLATRRYPAGEGLRPLAALRARHGVYAVLGNHDHWRGATEVSAALKAAGVRLLVNESATIGGMRLGGVDDDFTDHADVGATVAAMSAEKGAGVLLSHSPDVGPRTARNVTLILAGHTHCGQIRLPVIGAPNYESKYGDRFSCGLITEGSRRILVTGGVGTSVLPLRLGAAPELWLLTLGPA